MHRCPSPRPFQDSGFTIADEMPRKKKDDASFGPRLVTLRKAGGLTQVQLAEATKTTQRSTSYYENDDGVPPSSIVMVLAQALQVSADELLGWKPPPKFATAAVRTRAADSCGCGGAARCIERASY